VDLEFRNDRVKEVGVFIGIDPLRIMGLFKT
jgi:hypothetical protein